MRLNLKIIVILFLTFLSIKLSAQENCDCSEMLKELVGKIENNYPGFNDKVKNKTIYESFKKELNSKSKITDLENCKALLKEYINFFQDGHIYFMSNKQQKKKPKQFVETNYEKLKQLVNRKQDSLLGVWKNEKIKIGIVREDSIYKAFYISPINKRRKPNEVLFTLDKGKYTYYFSNQNQFSDKYLLNKDTLKLFTLNSAYIRDNREVLNPTEIRNEVWKLEGFYIKKLTSKTTIIKLGSFNYSFVDRISTLISENKNLIENSENLIIDLRGNSGGTTLAGASLYPFILSNNTRNFGSEYYSTKFLINSLENYLKRLKNNKGNKSDIERISSNISKLEENLGKFITYPNEEKVSIIERENSLKSPRQVVILADKNTGSAGESFLFVAKQSKKVKVLGTPTYGALDYASARVMNFNCEGLSIVIPTNRSSRLPDYPIDNIGIQPDIYLDKSIKDWIEYATKYLEE